MKKIFSVIALSVLLLLPSACSKSNEKADELLSSIPANTPAVCLVNMERMAQESGVTKDGDNIVLPEGLKNMLGNEAKDLITSGALEMSVVAVYVDADAMCLTGFTSNPSKLSDLLGDDIIVRGNRFWMAERSKMNLRIAENAESLNKDESFASTTYTSTLTDLDNYDIRAIANIQGLVALSGNRQAQMAMGLIGSMGGARYVTYDLTSSAGKVEMEVSALDNDFNKIDTPKLPEIDIKGVEKLHGRMELAGALAVNEKMMTELAQNLPNLLGAGPSLPDASRVYRLLGSIDGTIAVGGTLTGNQWQWEVAVPFAKEKDAQDAIAYANMFTEGSSIFTRQDKNILLISNANLNAPFDGPQNVSVLKGKFMGIVAGQALFNNPNLGMRQQLPIKSASLTCGRKNGTQTLTLTIETTGNRNGLITLAEAIGNN